VGERGAAHDSRDHCLSRAAEPRIGVSGWTYPPWRGAFYPKGLRQRDELAYAGRVLNSIEINGSFYSLQRPESYASWAAATPEDFVFAVKGPRFITHMKRLRESETPLANFFASGVLRLGAKLGPVLWQLPPNFRFDAGRIEAYLAMLPRDTEAAAVLACRHDHRVAGRTWLQTGTKRPLRHALEIRHESFRDPDFIALLRRQDVALVCADTVDWPLLGDLTADFVYCRLHGSTELYRSGYDAPAIERWSGRVRAWLAGDEAMDLPHVASFARKRRRDVFLYFDNTDKLRAPLDAQALMARLGVTLAIEGAIQA